MLVKIVLEKNYYLVNYKNIIGKLKYNKKINEKIR